MRFLIDTNCCIYLFSNAYPKLTARIGDTAAGDIVLSAISFAELALGTFHGKLPDRKALDLLARQMPVQPFDEAAARAYAELPFKRGSYDRLIGAHAFSLGLTVITGNEADFADIPGLRVENWTI